MAATVRDSTVTIASSTSISPTLPTYAAGDVLVLFVWGYTSISTPTGYTSRASNLFTTPFGADLAIEKVFTKVATGSESSPTMTHGENDQIGAVLVAVQGADTSTVVDGSVPTGEDQNPGQPAAPSVTVSGADSLLLCGVGVFPSSGGGTFTPPSGMTELEDGVSWDSYSVASLALSASGPTGTKTFATTATTPWFWGSASIAIKSAPAGTSASAENAAVTLTAHAPTVAAGGNAAAAVAPVGLSAPFDTGTALSLEVESTDPIEVGLAANNATVVAPSNAAAAVAATTVAAHNPTITTSASALAGAASFTTAALDSTVATGADTNAPAPEAPTALVAHDATVTTGSTFTASAEAVALGVAAADATVTTTGNAVAEAAQAVLTAHNAVVSLEPVVTFRFQPPVVEDVPGVAPTTYGIARRLFRHYVWTRGRSVLKIGGEYFTVDYPSQTDIDTAEAAYIGGHVYTVDETEAAALTAAGYGGGIS